MAGAGTGSLAMAAPHRQGRTIFAFDYNAARRRTGKLAGDVQVRHQGKQA